MEKILYKSSKTGAIDLIIDPNNPNTIYASFWQVYRTPYKMLGGGPECSLYKSIDGGKSWEDISKILDLQKTSWENWNNCLWSKFEQALGT